MQTVKTVDAGQQSVTTKLEPAFGANKHLYTSESPLDGLAFTAKLNVLQEIDAYLRAKDPRV